jgi:hypothetical protein
MKKPLGVYVEGNDITYYGRHLEQQVGALIGWLGNSYIRGASLGIVSYGIYTGNLPGRYVKNAGDIKSRHRMCRDT